MLERLLAGARSGRSGVLMVRGEAGVGKTALLDYLLTQAAGCRVTRAAGIESEMELPYAGLHQLCAGLLPRVDTLPTPQAAALATAFGLREGDAGSLPGRAGDAEPAIRRRRGAAAALRGRRCAVVGSRLGTGAGIRCPTRGGRAGRDGLRGAKQRRQRRRRRARRSPGVRAGGPERHRCAGVAGLGPRGPLDPSVRDRIVAETRGNPLALLELPRGAAPAELAGGFGRPDAAALSARIEESFRRRLIPLPPSTQRLLLIAAADPVGDPLLVWRAAERLGVDPEAAAPATAAGVLEFGTQVAFAIPWCARPSTAPPRRPSARRFTRRSPRRRTPSGSRPSRVAPCVRGGERRRGRRRGARAVGDPRPGTGRLAAAAAFRQRAAELTPDPVRRAERALKAAQSKHQAGAEDAAMHLLAMAQAGPLDELARRARASAARPDHVLGDPRPGRAAAAAAGRAEARAARRDAGSRDVPRRLLRGAVRRPLADGGRRARRRRGGAAAAGATRRERRTRL